MLNGAVKRCQAIPIVGVRPMTTNHAIDTTIFRAATTTIASASTCGGSPVSASPSQAVSG